jgi:hypothetical protein
MARLSALIAALAALVVAPVQAASFAFASLSDLKITLFDLNPADGVTPGIIELDLGTSFGTIRASDAANFEEGSFGTVATALSVASASATFTGIGPGDVTLITASGSALGTTVPGSASAYFASADSPSVQEAAGTFLLTANTGVTFSALANVAATVTVGDQEGRGFFESAEAGATLRVFEFAIRPFDGPSDERFVHAFGTDGPESLSSSGRLSVSFIPAGDIAGTRGHFAC